MVFYSKKNPPHWSNANAEDMSCWLRIQPIAVMNDRYKLPQFSAIHSGFIGEGIPVSAGD